MADKNLDEYKPLKFYKDNSKARQNGFAKFKDKQITDLSQPPNMWQAV